MLKTSMISKTFIFGMIFVPQLLIAQIDFNRTPDDDLGYVEDAWQEAFFEALKQKGIENYDRAIQSLQKCLTLKGGESVVYYEMGKNYIQLKNYGAAEDALKTAIEMEPANEWYLDELYGVYIEMQEYDKAISTVKQLVKYHPDYKEDLAGLYVRSGMYEEAKAILDELDSKFGVSVSREKMREEIFSLSGDDKGRIAYLKERIAAEPSNDSNYLKLIYWYSEKGDKANAFKVAKQLEAANPQSEMVHLALYKFHLDDGNAEDAIASMKRILKSNTIKPDAKTRVLMDFTNFVKQNPSYESHLLEVTTEVLDDQSSKSDGELADYFLRKNEKGKALEYYQKALEKDPNNFKLLENVLLLKLDLGMHKEAAAESESALDSYPAQPILYLINGVAYNELKQADKAIDALEMGLDYIIDDNQMEADFYNQLSVAYKLNNNNSKAEAFSKKARELLNNND